jgi:hypothetical protein
MEIFRNRYYKLLPTGSFSVTSSAVVEVSKYRCWKKKTFGAQLQYVREGEFSPVEAM